MLVFPSSKIAFYIEEQNLNLDQTPTIEQSSHNCLKKSVTWARRAVSVSGWAPGSKQDAAALERIEYRAFRNVISGDPWWPGWLELEFLPAGAGSELQSKV